MQAKLNASPIAVAILIDALLRLAKPFDPTITRIIVLCQRFRGGDAAEKIGKSERMFGNFSP